VVSAIVARDVVADQNGDRLRFRALFAKAGVRRVVLQPDFLDDHLDQCIKRDWVFRVLLG
jgi:hypothetical protein